MFSVGQIYYSKKFNLNLTITKVYNAKLDAICNDGSVLSNIAINDSFLDWVLLANYNSWLDAVNSIEFKIMDCPNNNNNKVKIKKEFKPIYQDSSFKADLFNEDLEAIELVKKYAMLKK